MVSLVGGGGGAVVDNTNVPCFLCFEAFCKIGRFSVQIGHNTGTSPTWRHPSLRREESKPQIASLGVARRGSLSFLQGPDRPVCHEDNRYAHPPAPPRGDRSPRILPEDGGQVIQGPPSKCIQGKIWSNPPPQSSEHSPPGRGATVAFPKVHGTEGAEEKVSSEDNVIVVGGGWGGHLHLVTAPPAPSGGHGRSQFTVCAEVGLTPRQNSVMRETALPPTPS